MCYHEHPFFRFYLIAAVSWICSAGIAQADWPLFCRPRPACPTPLEPLTVPPEEKKLLEPVLTPVTTAALGDGLTSVPNIQGNLLGAGKSVRFFVNRTEGRGFLFDNGTTNVTNAKVADNNSPIPQDRIGFRYNFFHNALSVTGLGDTPRFDPFIQGNVEPSRTRLYDVQMYTVDFEKTFLDGLCSLQLRVPFATTVSSDLNLSFGSIDPSLPIITQDGSPALNVTRTPGETLGHEATEFGNMQVIFKSLLWQEPRWAISGGLSLGIPTAQDTTVRVADYIGSLALNLSQIQRVREFHIENETWALSPFLAFVAVPNSRWFTQGFMQVEFPLNSSDVVLRETLPTAIPGLNLKRLVVAPGGKLPPFEDRAQLNEQTLLHLDWNIGYWLMRRPENRFLTGIAPVLELHYTTTLNDADIITLQKSFPVVPAKLPNGSFDFL
ncbi:MAG: hypothetical protein L0Y72_12715, partial [Gemmataceae bacterium]|nr:hypothetical protein [Gemmataceae bacterium]